MTKTVECIPNFSEGRDEETLRLLTQTATSAPGVSLLDRSTDIYHNRSVFTLAGSPEGVAEAVFSMAQTAVRRIDLTKHRGEHPRMGAVDVIPFVPMRGMEASECAAIPEALGRRLWEELRLPVFLYEVSARSPERRSLAVLRRGQFEGMAAKIATPEFRPDYGDALHPTAGIVAVGIRKPLIAFNINLNTPDIDIARDIAKTVRESGGGLKNVRAIGVMVRNAAQVSLNMTDYRQTPLYVALELVRSEAARRGVAVAGTEIVGLAPAEALADCARHYLGLEDFDAGKRVLENRLWE